MDVIKSKREKVKANKVNCVNKVSKEKEREKGRKEKRRAKGHVSSPKINNRTTKHCYLCWLAT